jgi:hypothetical protein
MGELLLRELLPIKLTNGNDGRGSKWFRADKRRKAIVKQLATLKREPFGEPVAVVITRVLGKGERLWDADSVGRGNAKELIDSLVELGWWVDDGPKFIRQCDYRQDANNRERGSAVQIEVFSLQGAESQ